MRLRDLRGLPVVDPTAARKMGTVSDFRIDPGSGRLAALDLEAPGGGDGGRVPGQRIRRIGRDAVMLTGALTPTVGAAGDEWLDTACLVGLEVLGDDGVRIGRLLDAHLNPDTLAIETYLLDVPPWRRWFGSRGRIEPPRVAACSRDLMVVATGRLGEGSASRAEQPGARAGLALKSGDRAPAASGKPVAVFSASDGAAKPPAKNGLESDY